MSNKFRFTSVFGAVVLLFALIVLTLPASAQQALGFNITYGGRVYDSTTDQTTFTYIVTGTGVPPDLSHFDLEIPVCSPELVVVGYNPTSAVTFGTDPNTGITGIKWDVPLLTVNVRVYTITFQGNVVQGTVDAAIKGGPGFEVVSVPGPACPNPSIQIEKFLSIDGGANWQRAASAPGPSAALANQVSFRLLVTNNGAVPLTNLSLTDSVYSTAGCSVPTVLTPQETFECVLGPVNVNAGQHTNTATVSGNFNATVVSDTDSAYYFGGEHPSISVQKLVSTDGGISWVDADSTPGPNVNAGSNVWFRFVVNNSGSSALSGLTLTDNTYDTSVCALPGALQPGDNYNCVIGPFPAQAGQHANMATVTGSADGIVATATDMAHYFGEEVPEPVYVVIEGPVTAIHSNVITVFNISILIDVDAPLLATLQVGDMVRIEGHLVTRGAADHFIVPGTNNTFGIIAVVVVIIDGTPPVAPTPVPPTPVPPVPVAPPSDANCANPPPPWAPAHGWRARCDPNYEGYTGQPPGRGRGRGRGN